MNRQRLFRCIRWRAVAIAVLAIALLGLSFGSTPAWASLTDDRFDGNIFALYAGNGSLVPPKVGLAASFKAHKPALVMFYLEDSSDCKQFSATFSQLQAGYGRAANLIPINVDSLAFDSPTDSPTDLHRYYHGPVPQLVIFDQDAEVVFDEVGQIPYETIDDRLREVFDLLPREESVELKRRLVNEVNVELAQ
ncbi:MAG: thylakoid membrane photosystem I accumulation factor [Cyanobacteria bacterium P01_H01_bin.121]